MAKHDQKGQDEDYVCGECQAGGCHNCIDVLRAAYTTRRLCKHRSSEHADAVERAGERHRTSRRAAPGDPCITCPECGRTSHHPEDIATGYCAYCHKFTTKRARDASVSQVGKVE